MKKLFVLLLFCGIATVAFAYPQIGVYKILRYNIFSPDGTESYWDDFVYPKSSTIAIDEDKVTIIADNSIICLQAGIDLSSKRIIVGNETYKARDYKTGNEFHIIFAYNNVDGTEVLSVRCVYKETSELFQAIKLNTPF